MRKTCPYSNLGTCKCPVCMAPPGSSYIQVMISNNQGYPVQVGSIEIKADPLLVEDWMLDKVSADAAKALTKYVVNSNFNKTVN